MKNRKLLSWLMYLVCAITISFVSLFFVLTTTAVKLPSWSKPSPAIVTKTRPAEVVFSSKAVEELRTYAVEHKMPYAVRHYSESGLYCINIGDVFDNKQFRCECKSSPNDAAQILLDDLRNNKPATFDAQTIDSYDPEEQ